MVVKILEQIKDGFLFGLGFTLAVWLLKITLSIALL